MSTFVIDWVLTSVCNYGCGYCIQNENPNQTRIHSPLNKVEVLLKRIESLQKKIVISLTGESLLSTLIFWVSVRNL
jgi:organic radical activating enzyme